MKSSKKNIFSYLVFLSVLSNTMFGCLYDTMSQEQSVCEVKPATVLVDGNEYFLLAKDPNNYHGLLLHDPSNPFLIARDTEYTGKIIWQLLGQWSGDQAPTDSKQLVKWGLLAYKFVERYALKMNALNQYFPLSECIDPSCLLTRKHPNKSIRHDFSRLIANNLKNIPSSDGVLRLISNATGFLLMEMEIINMIHKELSRSNGQWFKKIEFHCIDPFFNFIGTGRYEPFDQAHKACTLENRNFVISCINMLFSEQDYRKLILNKFFSMHAIDQLIRSSKENCGIEVSVHTYVSIGDFVRCNNSNNYPFPLCYTVDLLNVLDDFDRYNNQEYETLYAFLVHRRKTTNIPSCTFYWADHFEKFVPEIFCQAV
ncbi:hypothetical protein EKK58_06930 [Candidatus Dependentiae bacterium]|nr:MAG: hypothetical protein EKK58_06930 [Candidatus Dependentiae bacterium]